MPYIFLLLHIVLSSGFSLGLKCAILRRRDMYVVGGLNYLMACAAGTVWLFLRGATVGWAGGVFGGSLGLVYFIAYFLLVYAARHQGVAATTAFGHLSAVIPILFSALLWREYPTVAQAIGILVAGTAIAMLDVRRDLLAEISGPLRLSLVGFFLCVGTAGLAAKGFTEAGAPDQRSFYIWMVFASSGACAAVLLLRHRRWPTREDWLWGGVMGACNIGQAMCLLPALEHLPGIIVFPVAACSTIIFVGAVVVAFFGERPTARMYVGMATAAVAVVLLNLRLPTRGS